MRTRGRSRLEGRWRIIETEMWDQEALDLLGPAEIRFDSNGQGSLHMIAIEAGIDFRTSHASDPPRLEFSWSGFDEGDPISGRGFAEQDDNRLVGRLFIHCGDESGFVAERFGS